MYIRITTRGAFHCIHMGIRSVCCVFEMFAETLEMCVDSDYGTPVHMARVWLRQSVSWKWQMSDMTQIQPLVDGGGE